MQYQIIILFCFSIYSVKSQNCTIKVNTLNLALAMNEQQWWGLQDTFFTGQNLSYEISDNTQSYFTLINPIQTSDSFQSYNQPANIVQVVPFRQSINGAWLNSFAFLDNKNGYNIFWSISSTMDGTITPQFKQLTAVLPSTTSQICYSLDFITLTPIQKVIVDCFDPSLNKNYFQVVYSNYSYQIDSNTDDLQGNINGRQIQVQRLTSQEDVYIYRAASIQQAPLTINNSIIEVFKLDYSNNLQYLGTLDKNTLAKLVGDTSDTFTFNLVEFELEGDFIYVLDQSGKIYRLIFQKYGKWILDSTLILESTPYAMDINQEGNTNVIVLYQESFVLYEWKILSQEYNKVRLYNTGFNIDSASVPNFYISQNHIFLQNNQFNAVDDMIIIFEIRSDNILCSKTVPKKLNWLIHPYLGKFISFSGTGAQAWAFGEGQLQFNYQYYKTNLQMFTLIATSTIGDQTVICTSTINLQVYDNQDKQIYLLGNQSNLLILPEFIQEKVQLPVNPIVSGPNINFDQGQSSLIVNLTDVTVQQLQVSSFNGFFPNAADIVFLDMIGLDDNQSFFQIFQTKNFTIHVYYCEIIDFISRETICQSVAQINAYIQIIKQGFQIWQNGDQVRMASITKPNQISIYDCNQYNCSSVSNIYDNITSFYFTDYYLWTIIDSKFLQIYNAFYPFQLFQRVDSNIAQENGYTGTWSPRKLVGNKIFNPNIIFIDNRENLLIVQFNQQITFLKQIKYGNPNQDNIEISIGPKTFFVCGHDQSIPRIFEYNYEDLGQIKLQKQVSYYSYYIQNPFQTSFSESNGYLYATSSQNIKSLILIFKPNNSQRDQLFKVIDIEVSVQENILFSVTGDENMLITVSNLNALKIYSVRKQHTIQIGPGVVSPMVSKDVRKTMRVFNQESTSEIDYSFNITLFNTHSYVEFNPSAFNAQTQGKLLISQYIPIQKSWFNGNVLNFKIKCQDCEDAIKIENFLNPTSLVFPFNYVTDFDSLGDTGFIAQTPKQLWFIKDGKQYSPILNLDVSYEIQCQLVKNLLSGTLILSICSNSTGQYVHITSCVALNDCFSAGYLPLAGAKEIQKFLTVTTQQGISLVILSVNDQSLDSYSEGSLITYSLVSQRNGWIIEKTNQINLTSQSGLFYPTDVQFSQYSEGFYKFFIIDAEIGLWTVNGKLMNGILQIDNTGDLINLYDQINGYGGFISLSTRFYGVGIYKLNLTDPKNIYFGMIVTTSNVAQFAIGLVFDNTDPQNNPAILAQINFDYEFNRYGDAPALNKLLVYQNQFFMLYGSNKNPNITSLIRYDIPTQAILNREFQNNPIEVQFIGGQELNASLKNNYIPLYLEDKSEAQTLNLYSNQYNLFTVNQIENFPRLVLNTSRGLTSQQITIIAYNEQVGNSVKVTSNLESIEIIQYGWKWWYSFIIVLSILIIVIGLVILYLLCRRKRVNNLVQDELPLFQQQRVTSP